MTPSELVTIGSNLLSSSVVFSVAAVLVKRWMTGLDAQLERHGEKMHEHLVQEEGFKVRLDVMSEDLSGLKQTVKEIGVEQTRVRVELAGINHHVSKGDV